MTAIPRILMIVHTLLALGGFATLLHLHRSHPVMFVRFVTEDQWGEYATAVSFLAAAGMAAVMVISRPRLRAMIFSVLAIGCFLVAAEELAWGQRVFRFDAPDALRQINEQDETTLHNIRGVHDIIRARAFSLTLAGAMIGSVIASAWLFKVAPDRWRQWRRLGIALPGVAASTWFILSAGSLAIGFTIKADEIGELLLGAGVAALMLELLMTSGPRPLTTTAGQWATTLVVVLAIAGGTLVLSHKRPGPMDRRLELAAHRDYPDRNMHAQARMIRDYLDRRAQGQRDEVAGSDVGP